MPAIWIVLILMGAAIVSRKEPKIHVPERLEPNALKWREFKPDYKWMKDSLNEHLEL